MEFHLSFTPKPFDVKIRHHHKLLLAGSCFTEQIGQKLSKHKFNVLENPNGILFNPLSIARSLQSYVVPKIYTQSDLFLHQELWGSWDHHTRFSHPDPVVVLKQINDSQLRANAFLKEADWILLTLGSAFAYEQNGEVVANCHKVPTDKFSKRLLTVQEVVTAIEQAMSAIYEVNKGARFIFTISPVRHLRDGFVENNRSKATLVLAVQELISKHNNAMYFPAYELVIDDLRDYRFYAEDMVHPNYAATNYVWEKFREACLEGDTIILMKELADINTAKNHKAFNPASAAHRKFLQTYRDKTVKLAERLPYVDFRDDILAFSVPGGNGIS